jgi:membrane protein
MTASEQSEPALADERAGRPEPDEAPLEDEGRTGRKAVLVRAVKAFLADNGTMLASALAYSTFFAIPSALLVLVGGFTLVAGPGTIDSLMQHFQTVMPAQATSLLGGSLHRLSAHPGTSIVLTVVGAVLALWSTTGAMTTYMTALNIAYGRRDRRPFLRKRLVAVELVAVVTVAFLLVAVLLMFGQVVERLLADHAGRAAGAIGWIWWIGQWPILVAGLLTAFATLLHLGPDVEARWRCVTPGSLLATAIWLAASGGFAFYTSHFGSYDKTWGSLAAVIVMLTWLWLAAIALLLGAELNVEVERSREPRPHEPARPEPQLAGRR